MHTLRLSRAKVILTDAERRARVDEVADRLDAVTDIVVLDDSLSHALMREAGCVDDPGEPDEVGALFYTSGTTGPSKAVATSWNYLFSVAATVVSSWELRPGRRCGRRCRSST